MKRLRQTILNDYLTCAYKCFKSWGSLSEEGYYENNDSKQNKYSASGIVVHEVMEEWGKDVQSNKLKDNNFYHDMLNNLFNGIDSSLFANELEIDIFRNSINEQLDWLMEQTYSNEILFTELDFEVTEMINGIEEPVIGTIDRIDGNIQEKRISLIDYKTGKPFTKKKLKTNIQAFLYTLAFFKQYGFLPEKFVFYFSKHKRKQIIWITPEFLQDAGAEVISIYYKMKNNEWKPNCSNKYFCKNFCEYYKECPKYSNKKQWDIEYEVFNPLNNI